MAALSIITGGGKWVEISIAADLLGVIDFIEITALI
jgi:hypothetical protein